MKVEYPMYFGASSNIIMLARELRNNMTESEKIIWQYLRKRQINGYKFRRQHPVDRFIVDFFCYEAMLSIEIDGGIHNLKEQKERDIERTKILNLHGIIELRFTNNEVKEDISSVIQKIKVVLPIRN